MSVSETTDLWQVWIGCLAAYNNGSLHGEWVDLTDGPEAFDEACARILKTSPVPDAEELDVFDTNGIGSIGLMESRRIAERLDELDDPLDMVRLLIWHGGNIGCAVGDCYPEDARVLGPFRFGSDADAAAEEWIGECFIESVNMAMSGNHPYLSFDWAAARSDMFDIREAYGAWWAVQCD